MIEKHLLKLRARAEITRREEEAIRAAVSEFREYPADTTVIHSGERVRHSTMLLEGFMSRQKVLLDGARQITEINVAGDFVDLHSFTLKRLDHDIVTFTPCRVGIVPHENLTRITEEFPHLTRVYWFSTNLDAAIHREWALSLGRRSASAKLAALFCEMQVRLSVVGLADDSSYLLPLTQADLSECLGLTDVHINRTLRVLRDQGVVTMRAGRVTILDKAELARIGEFDAAYLYLGSSRPD
jgi:CRP-like cAMP-binding protein